MARISAAEGDGGLVVAVEGALGARDLRRLERACGPAIEQRRSLRITLTPGGHMDAAARAYVEQLRARGALVQERGHTGRR
jgi:hypothetical protein